MNPDFKLPMLLDGGTQASLSKYGFDFKGCAEEWILNNEQAIIDLQTDYIKAGSDAIYTPTYGANSQSFKKFGMQENVHEVNSKLAEISRNIAQNKLVGGCLSSLNISEDEADEMNFSAIISVYKEQAKALDPFVDFFIGETLTSLSEIRAILLACRRFKKPVFITIELLNDGQTKKGLSPLPALITAQSMGAFAFGFNCSTGFEVIQNALIDCKPYAKVPLIAKPSNGGKFNKYRNPDEFAESMKSLINSGAEILGGCCGTSPEYIEQLRHLVDNYQFPKKEIPEQGEELLIATSEKEPYFLNPDRIEISPMIYVGYDMTQELLEYSSDESSFDILNIVIENADDALVFAENQYMASLPVMFSSSDELALRSALLLYQGVAFVNSQTSIEIEILEKISKKYGSIIY